VAYPLFLRIRGFWYHRYDMPPLRAVTNFRSYLSKCRHSAAFLVFRLWHNRRRSMLSKPSHPNLRLRDARPDDLPRLETMICALAQHHGDVPDINAQTLKRDIFGAAPWV